MSSLTTLIAEDSNTTAPSGTIRVDKSFRNTAPTGYLQTNSTYLQASYPALYSRLGLVNAFAWTPRNSSTTSAINTVVYQNLLYLYGGAGGVLGTSTDGVTWTTRTSGTTSAIRTITYQNGLYLYGGDGGCLGTSTDGITWTARNSGTNTGAINSIIWDGTRYVANGDIISISTDGVTWENLWTNNYKYGMGWSPVTNIIVIGGPAGFMITSSDGGSTWVRRTSAISADIGGPLWSTVHNMFISVGGNQIQTSTDGITWTLRATISTVSSIGQPRAVAPWTGSYYVMWTNTAGTIVRSADGITWAAVTGAGTFPSTITDLNYNPSTGVGLMIGQGGAVHRTTSADGTGWALLNTPSGFFTYNVRWDAVNNFWILFGANNILTSIDNGTTWVNRASSGGQMFWAWWTGSYWITSGNGWQNKSSDGITWTGQNSGLSGNLIGIVNDTSGNLYLLSNFNDGRVVNKSTNAGSTWNTILLCGNIKSVVKNGTDYVYVRRTEWYDSGKAVFRGSGGALGLNAVDVSPGNELNFGTFANGLYLVSGVSGKLYTSTNGTAWTQRTSGTTSVINSITYGNGLFAYSTTAGGLSTSTDAVSWTARVSGTSSDINSLVYGSLFVYAGNAGMVATSTDASTPSYATYNINTEFFVPEVNIGITNINNKVYIKT